MPLDASMWTLGQRRLRVLSLAVLPLLFSSLIPISAQSQGRGLKLAIGDVGIGLGDVPRLDGVRLNIRDRDLVRARGLNATIWSPHQGSQGVVQGLALGLPVTGASDIYGLTVGLGTGANRTLAGIGIGVLGVGAGTNLRGIAVGGIGAGCGEDLVGLAIGGIGVGSGRDVRAIAIGGVGVGAGGGFTGLAIGGLGVGAGDDLRGIAIGGIGVGAGGRLTGLAIGGLAVGAPELSGVAAALAAGGRDVHGLVLAPAYFTIEREGALTGVSVSTFNRIEGRQHGLAIGILNIAGELHGLQLGAINVAHNKSRLPILPLLNYNP